MKAREAYKAATAILALLVIALLFSACTTDVIADSDRADSMASADAAHAPLPTEAPLPSDKEDSISSGSVDQVGTSEADVSEAKEISQPNGQRTATAEEIRADLGIAEDFRESFVHGEKGAAFQKYIVLHDTEGGGTPWDVVNSWDASGNLVAAHFVVGKDGSVVQCVPMDSIAHHAGFGDAGHNAFYGVEDESRDDRQGTSPIGDWAPDYGMNSYSIGIEMIHVGGEGDYPEEQLTAVDKLIAYIDAYYGGYGGAIIDHKAWRSGNSDTSAEFSEYLAHYQDCRVHA